MGQLAKSLHEALELLQERGLKRTQARRALLDVFMREDVPLSPEAVHAKLKSHGCDLATVYRNIVTLEKAGLLRRRDSGDRVQRYEFCDPRTHHHPVYCRQCMGVTFVENVFAKRVSELLRKQGFQEIHCQLEIEALCPACCRSKGNAAARL